MKNKNEQLELGIQNICVTSEARSRIIPLQAGRKSTISSLWFSRMRQLVEAAPDWPPLPRHASPEHQLTE